MLPKAGGKPGETENVCVEGNGRQNEPHFNFYGKFEDERIAWKAARARAALVNRFPARTSGRWDSDGQPP